MPPIILLDTNVFIASRFGKTSRRIVAAWEAQRFMLGISAGILSEYRHILGRVPFLPAEVWARWQAGFQDPARSCNIEPTEKLDLSEDPADNKFLEVALALDAEAIVSSDHHLLDVAGKFPIPILKPAEFLIRFWERVGEAEN